LASINANGTRDIGLMQFNTRYLESMAPYGIRAVDVAGTDCYPFDLAAWRIAGHLARDPGDLWTRAANYHSRTARYNAVYRQKLVQTAATWESYLREQFPVREIAHRGED
jgi:hypothetical protein